MLASSKAAQNGLKVRNNKCFKISITIFLSKPGDQIVRVNGLTLADTTHKEFVDLIKLRKSLALAVKSLYNNTFFLSVLDVMHFFNPQCLVD